MLVIVAVGRILKCPPLTANGNWNRAEVLPCGVGSVTCKACVFNTKLAFWIGGRLVRLCRRNITGVLLGLRAIYGDIKRTVLRFVCPLHILRNSACSDVIYVTAEAIIPIGRRLGTLFIRILLPFTSLILFEVF